MSPCPPLIITRVCPWLINHLSDPWNFNKSNGILLRSNWRKPYPKFYGSELLIIKGRSRKPVRRYLPTFWGGGLLIRCWHYTPSLLGWCPQSWFQVQPWGNRRRDPPRGSQVWYLDVPVTADRDIWRSQFIKMEAALHKCFFFPKWMVYSGTSYLYPIKIYDLGFVVEYFLLTSYWKNTLW